MVVHHSIHQMGCSTITKNIRCACNLFGWSMEVFVSGRVSVYDDEFTRLQFTQGLSECDLDLISFANELILLRDGYLQFSTDF